MAARNWSHEFGRGFTCYTVGLDPLILAFPVAPDAMKNAREVKEWLESPYIGWYTPGRKSQFVEDPLDLATFVDTIAIFHGKMADYDQPPYPADSPRTFTVARLKTMMNVNALLDLLTDPAKLEASLGERIELPVWYDDIDPVLNLGPIEYDENRRPFRRAATRPSG